MREAEEGAESPGFWGTIWGGLKGAAEENPTYGQIGVDLGVSLIPGVGEVAAARDVSAHLYYMVTKDEYTKAMRWVGLGFSLIALFPEIGAAIKGASRFLLKGGREGLELLLKLVGKVKPALAESGRLWTFIAEHWSQMFKFGSTAWFAALEKAGTVFGRVSSTLGEKIAQIRKLSAEKLPEAFETAWSKIRAAFGKGGEEAAEKGAAEAAKVEKAEAEAVKLAQGEQKVGEGATIADEAKQLGEVSEAAPVTNATSEPRTKLPESPKQDPRKIPRSKPKSPASANQSPPRRTGRGKGRSSGRQGGSTRDDIREVMAEEITRGDPAKVQTKRLATDAPTILSKEQFLARFRDRIADTEKHHSFFKYLLRAINKSRGVRGIPRHGRLTKLDKVAHEALHELFDALHPMLARRLEASDEIARAILEGVISPREIADLLLEFYRDISATSPQLLPAETLIQIEKVIASIMSRGNI